VNIRRFIKKFTAIILVAVMLVVTFSDIGNNVIVAEASEHDPIIIVLDPGHGGDDPGACNSTLGTNEARSNWAIAVACKNYLEQYENVVVYMTKTEHQSTTLSKRVDFVVSNNADLCVSFHNNSAGYGIQNSARGCEVYRSIVEPFASNTNQLAQDICNNLAALGLYNRGVKTWRSTIPSTPDDDYLTLIAGPISEGIPSILIEHAFVNNYADAQKLNNPDMLRKMGEADAKAIAKYFKLKLKGSAATGIPTLETTTCMETYGWIATQPNGMMAGFPQYRPGDHRDKGMKALKVDLNNEGVSGDIVYSAFVSGAGWLPEVSDGNIIGNPDSNVMLEAVRFNLTGDMSSKYDIYYRVNSDQNGWMGWAKNGENSGTIGFGCKIRAIQVRLIDKNSGAPGSTINAFKQIIKAPEEAKVAYATHIQSYGWEVAEAYDGLTSGTTGLGKRLEGIVIRNNTGVPGSIEYQVHCQTYGWMDWVADGAMAGTSGQSKRLEAIKIRLTGELAEKYDIYYRVHAQSYGWLDWAKNGGASGTSSYAKRLEAIEIVMVEKGQAAPGSTDRPYVSPGMVSYRTHVQSYGWQSNVSDGAVSGTSGESKRLEGIEISDMTGESGSIRYQVHCQTYGWMDWVSDGKMAGTTGESKRLEGIRIELTGELAEKYDVYYRVHCQTYGWLDWAKNGEASGSEGLAKRLEAIQIVYVQKGGNPPGPTDTPYINGNSTDTLNSSISFDNMEELIIE